MQIGYRDAFCAILSYVICSNYILVKVPRREHYVKYCGREANKARGEAECLIRHRDHNISVMYERPRCFNWFIVSIRSAGND